MIRAIKAVSSERGRDPREYALFAFGGNGPLFACSMAEALGIRKVIVPPCAGLFSSFGLLYADVEHHYSRTLRRLLRRCDVQEIERAWQALEQEALRQLEEEGFSGASAHVDRSAALHYQGQTYELSVPAPPGPIDERLITQLEEAFGAEHQQTYGHRAGPTEPVELVALQVVGRGLRERLDLVLGLQRDHTTPASVTSRRAYFGPRHGWLQVPVLCRADLSTPCAGPLIVEEYDATCLIPPHARARLDASANITIDVLDH